MNTYPLCLTHSNRRSEGSIMARLVWVEEDTLDIREYRLVCDLDGFRIEVTRDADDDWYIEPLAPFVTGGESICFGKVATEEATRLALEWYTTRMVSVLMQLGLTITK